MVHVWNPETGALQHVLHGHVGRAVSPSFAPRSDLFVTAGADRTARVWDAARGRPVAVLGGNSTALSAAAFSPDGRWVVTGDAAGVTDVWDWRRQKLLGALPMNSDYVNAVSFAPDGKRILSASNDSTAKIFTCDTCVPLDRLRAIVHAREHVIDTNGW
jgi:WD40 repeat protein